MKIFIGLGNPGDKYQKNRHNAGFILLNELKKIWNFPEFNFNKKFEAEISEGYAKLLLPKKESARNSDEKTGEEEKTILAKPQTFMNNSGESVQKIMSFYKLTPEDILVLHDDLDINFGEFRISNNSSAGGHNGVQDIIDKLGTQNFKRIRIGIEGEEKRKTRVIPGEVFVLENFSEEELEIIKNLAKEIEQKINPSN